MLLIVSDVETLDNGCADWAQLIHDDRIPLLPARREPGPRRSLNISNLIFTRHRPSRYRCTHRTRRHSSAGIHNPRSGALTPASLRFDEIPLKFGCNLTLRAAAGRTATRTHVA